MKKIFKYLKQIVTIIIVIFFLYYFYNNKEDLSKVLSISTPNLLLIIVLFAMVYFINGLFLKAILKLFKKNVPTLETFYVSVVSSLGNFFLPLRGGMVLGSVYLKKEYDFAYSHFISTLSGEYIIIFSVNAFLALLALIFIQLKQGVHSIPLYIFFGGLFVAMLLLTFVKFPIENIKKSKNNIVNKVLNLIKNILEGWNIIVPNKGLLLLLIFLTIASFTVTTFLYYFEFQVLGVNTQLVNIVLYNCLSGVSLLVSLTPSSLGIREGIFLMTSTLLGISNEEIMQLALLDRGVSIISLVLLFVILFSVRHLFGKDKWKVFSNKD